MGLYIIGIILASIFLLIITSYTIYIIVKKRRAKAIKSQHENILLGILGAVIFSLIGVALWVIVYQIGYFSGICSVAIMFFLIFGYKKLSKLKIANTRCFVVCFIICGLLIPISEISSIVINIIIKYQTTFNVAFIVTFNSHFMGVGLLYSLTNLFVAIVGVIVTSFVYRRYDRSMAKSKGIDKIV